MIRPIVGSHNTGIRRKAKKTRKMLSVREFEIPRTAVFGVKETADKVSAVSFYIRLRYESAVFSTAFVSDLGNCLDLYQSAFRQI